MEVDIPHCPIILNEMFQHAIEQGKKEAECMICQGCLHGLPKLDPKVDVSAVQLVGPQKSREEFKSLYYEVYKLQRLPRSPSVELRWTEELTAEVVSSLEDCLGQKGSKPPWTMEEPALTNIQPPRSKTPRRGEETPLQKGASLRQVKPTRGP